MPDLSTLVVTVQEALVVQDGGSAAMMVLI